MPEITGEVRMDIEVWCDTCGAGLCRTVNVRGTDLHVPPCAKCMEGARDDWYEAGLMEGRDDGYASGYEQGYADGVGETHDE